MHGAFLMIDALGWKGIWRRDNASPKDVLEKLGRLRDAATADVEGKIGSGLAAHAAFISDTIALGVEITEKDDETAPRRAILMASYLAARILQTAGEGTIPLAYRGCMTVGDFEIKDQFIVGSAVDEVGEAHEQSDAAIVWLMPKAKHMLETRGTGKYIPVLPRDLHLFGFLPRGEYPVPLKAGRIYSTYVVNPLPGGGPDARRRWIWSVLNTFSGSLDVEVKRQSTETFLRAVHDAMCGWEGEGKPTRSVGATTARKPGDDGSRQALAEALRCPGAGMACAAWAVELF